MLKKIFAFGIFMCLSTSFLVAQDLFSDLTYDELVMLAKVNNKPYYIDLTATWCFPCKLMNETVFLDYEVNQYTHQNYLALQLDIDDFDAMILKSEYKVSVLPTILFFNAKGKLIGKEEGLQTGTNFLQILKEYNLKK